MSTTTLPALSLGTESFPVQPHHVYEWLMPTGEVADGYGVTDAALRMHKRDHADELIEGKHWCSVSNPDANGRPTTYWTKRGVVRLGFFIRSERAKLFRDAAEDLIINVEDARTARLQAVYDASPWHLPKTFTEAVTMLAEEAGKVEELTARVDELTPKAAMADEVLACDDLLTPTIISKRLGCGPVMFNRWGLSPRA